MSAVDHIIDELRREVPNSEDYVPSPLSSNGDHAGEDPVVAFRVAQLRAALLTSDDVDALPPPSWLVEDVLHENTLAALFGRPGVGKSFLGLDLALCVATGTWWHGKAVRKGPVLYLAAEGTAGLPIRKQAWQEHNNVHSLDGALWLPKAVNFLDRRWVSALVQIVEELRPALVVVDTLARSLMGANENAAETMSAAVDAADQIKQASDNTTLLVHHTPREGTNLRGHTSLEGAVDTGILVKADGDNLYLESQKQKDAPGFQTIRLKRVTVGESCAVDGAIGRGTSEEDLAPQQIALLRVARHSCGTEGLTTSQLLEVSELPKRTFYRVKNLLVDAGFLTNVGTDKRPKWAATDRLDEPEVP